MPPRAVLLDLYDTLAHGDWWTWTAELAAITGRTPEDIARGFHATRMERNTGVYASAEDSLRHVLAAAGVSEPDDDMLERAIAAEEAFDERVALYDDVLPTIAALREGGSRLALVSNCSNTTRGIVDRLGFDQLFDTVVLSFELGVRKPDAGIYQAALAGIGAEPAEALFVDDQTAYCDGARALGIETRLIMRPTADPAEGFAEPNGHRVIASLIDLL
jgi:putative hydrolase of the HAD superfamily